MKFIRVHMSEKTVVAEAVPDAYRGIGGRALTSSYINDHVPATCDPLGADNVLVFAPGYFSGTPLINTSRLSVGAKSPLTGGIKESNVGGTVAASLASLGITAVVVEGMAAAGQCLVLEIDEEGNARLLDAPDCKGMRTYALVEKLKAAHGENNSITCIGPAGEMQLAPRPFRPPIWTAGPAGRRAAAGWVRSWDPRGSRPSLSALGQACRSAGDAEAFKAAAKAYAKAVKADEFSGEILPALGSAALVAPINEAGAFPPAMPARGSSRAPTRSAARPWPGSSVSAGARTPTRDAPVHHRLLQRICRQGRPKYVTSSLEYETIWSMGAMIGNDDLDAIARLDFLCDDIGLDTISTGVAVAVAMDAGYKSFGDARAAIEMVEAVATGSDFGKILGNGPAAVGKHFNHDRVYRS
jgi:aldehyde:ferredoxin oxidoreductase